MTELLDRWYGVSYVNWTPTTARSVRSIIDQQSVPGIGDVLVRELTAVTIDELYSRLRVSGRTDGKALSVGSVRRVHAVLHRALAQAMRWEWIWTNPAALASPPRSEPVEMRPPTPHDVAVLLAHTAEADPLLHLFLVLAATTGARRGQLLALGWTDIDLETASISFQRALVEGPSGPVLVPTKTRRSHRVALDPGTSVLLAAWLAGIAHAQAEVRDRFIFCYDEDGTRPWKANYVTKRFIRSRKADGTRSLPTSRRAALHGHSDARCRRRCADCGRPPRPCSCVHNTQRVRPRSTWRRQTCRATIVATPRRGHVSVTGEAQSKFGAVGCGSGPVTPLAFNPGKVPIGQ
jgi:integrase